MRPRLKCHSSLEMGWCRLKVMVNSTMTSFSKSLPISWWALDNRLQGSLVTDLCWRSSWCRYCRRACMSSLEYSSLITLTIIEEKCSTRFPSWTLKSRRHQGHLQIVFQSLPHYSKSHISSNYYRHSRSNNCWFPRIQQRHQRARLYKNLPPANLPPRPRKPPHQHCRLCRRPCRSNCRHHRQISSRTTPRPPQTRLPTLIKRLQAKVAEATMTRIRRKMKSSTRWSQSKCGKPSKFSSGN